MNYKLIYKDSIYRTIMSDYYQDLLGNYLKYLNWGFVRIQRFYLIYNSESYKHFDFAGLGELTSSTNKLFTYKCSDLSGDGHYWQIVPIN